jgi:beta-glucosidase
MIHEWGSAMGREFFDKGANVQLGPGVCVARIPRNGRNFEYASGEDPFLGATLVPPAVQGIQSQGVIATVKHFIDNSQETSRTTVAEDVDERTQFELYYPPYEAGAAANAGAVMCSYNKITLDGGHGNWSCENPHTLGHLKKDLGFKGG